MKKITSFVLSLLCLATSSHAANIVFVSFHSGDDTPSANAATAGFTRAPDVGYTELLRNAGHSVRRVVSSDIPNAADLNTADLVIISRSVPSGHYELDAETAAWNGITAPTMILGGYVLRNTRLGYTTGGTIPDTAGSVKLQVRVPGHPIFAGIPLDANNRMSNGYANIMTFNGTAQRGISVNTDRIAAGGVVLATIGTPGDPAFGGMMIAEWLKGDSMATSPVDTLGGHRLVLLTGSRENSGLTSEGAGIYDLTGDGPQIFLNAVAYMTSPRVSVLTVNTTNNDSPAAGETSLFQALSSVQAGDTVRFKIPGAGPHTITTPLGGYPLITADGVNIDGYTQPGAVPNTNPILSNNNAQIKIILDSTGAETAPNPVTPSLPLRRSTRLDFPNDVGNTGYGSSENCILGAYQADNVSIRGLSFLGRRTPGSDEDPSIYAVALIREAKNARVQGCWFGLAPGAPNTLASVNPPASATAAFRWRIGGDIYSEGAIVGTDGDGTMDRDEFNVILGGRIAMAMELPGLRISGNFVNVFPDGNTFLDLDANYQLWRDVFSAGGSDPDDVTIENFENGRAAHNTTVGTDGNGVSDANERNVFNHVVYEHSGEVYSAGTNLVVAGNYYGLGVNGTTKAALSTNVNADFIELPGTSSIRIGSNGDGVSDAIEANVIHNFSGSHFCVSGNSVPITARGNILVNNQFSGVPFADGDSGRSYLGYYAPYVGDPSVNLPPLIKIFTNNVISGVFAAASSAYPNALIDIYLLDPLALENQRYWPRPMIHPTKLLGSFTDNGPTDLNPAAGEFTFNLSGLSPTPAVDPSTLVAIAVTYSQEATKAEAGLAATSPMSNPISQRATLRMDLRGATVDLWWLGAPNDWYLQVNDSLDAPEAWFEFFGELYTEGRNVISLPFDLGIAKQFYRLRRD